MWFDDIKQIPEIAKKGETTIFVVPDGEKVEIPQAIVLKPEDKATITISQVRETLGILGRKQFTDQFIVFAPAEKLGLEAANALLKNLEEPGEKVHFVLITSQPSQLLATILSRAHIYFLKPKTDFSLEIQAGEQQKQLAKRLIAAKPADLVEIGESFKKKKTTQLQREEALKTLALAIEMLYKSYFITGKPIFIEKLPKFLTAYENIAQNGHIKLHIVADLC